VATDGHSEQSHSGPFTLAVDIGGTGIKVLVLDRDGQPASQRTAEPTPHPATPEAVLDVIAKLAAAHPEFDRVAAGFPGVIRNGVTETAHNLDPAWVGFDLAAALTTRLGKPTRVANDADIQGFGAIEGRGVELVLTLGTGVGAALFVHGVLVPNLELAHHPFRKGKTYEELLGKAALEKYGEKKWHKQLERAIKLVRQTFNFDVLYLGGGNAKRLEHDKLPADVKIVPNVAGLLGGIALWNPLHETELLCAPQAPTARTAPAAKST
jgi:polyphosphate glucokinase